MNIQVLGQRDVKWKNIQLGRSQTDTIGNYGCTITCIAMFAGITPDEVNSRLKAVKDGFVSEDLVNWTKLHEAIPWIDFISKGYTFDNNTVAKAINDNGACIVEVDFDGIINTPNDHHFVLFIGNQQMNDPWYGNTLPTNKYPILQSYVILKHLGDPQNQETQNSVPSGEEVQEDMITDQYKFPELGDMEYQVVRSKILHELPDLQAKYDDLNKRFQETVDSNNGWAEKLYNVEKERDSLLAEIRAIAGDLGVDATKNTILKQLHSIQVTIETQDKIIDNQKATMAALETQVGTLTNKLNAKNAKYIAIIPILDVIKVKVNKLKGVIQNAFARK